MKNYKMPIFLVIGVFIVQLLYVFIVYYNIPDASNRGIFGDSFGGLNAFFSGLAFGGMIYAIILQSRELSLQREELSLTRIELAASRQEQAKSAEAQIALVEQQILSAKIQGLSTIVQSRYQYAAAHGANANLHLQSVRPIEAKLLKILEEAGLGKIDLPKIP